MASALSLDNFNKKSILNAFDFRISLKWEKFKNLNVKMYFYNHNKL